MARYRDEARQARYRGHEDEEEEDFDGEEEGPGIRAPRLRRRSRGGETGGMDTIRRVARDLPSFARLLARLARDPRVSVLDKAIVLGAVAYIVTPIDIIPDIPVIGQIDDIYLLALALNRLVNRAGADVILDHWEGDVESLELAISLLDRAASLLPEPLRMLLGHRGG